MGDVAIRANVPSMLPPDTTDDLLIALWLHGKAKLTQEEYMRDIDLFREMVPRPFAQVTLADLQHYADLLSRLGAKPATIARRLASIKSLLSFAERSGYLPFNVGSMLKVKRPSGKLANRILSEEQVITMLAKEPSPRNHALLRLLYGAGLRVSELCNLTWQDIQPHGDTGQVTVIGKGDEERAVLLKKETYQEVLALRGNAAVDGPVFASRGGGGKKAGERLDPSQVLRIIKAAAKRADIVLYTDTDKDGNKVTRSHVSPHWMRHAHASHALENGASIALVQQTLGHKSIETTSKYTHARPETSSSHYLKI